MAVGVQHHAPASLPPGKRPGTHCTRRLGGWQGRDALYTVTTWKARDMTGKIKGTDIDC
jgi:hypothetical protein